MSEYQKLYEQLFHLIMSKPHNEEPPECDVIRRKMDALPDSKEEKEAWGRDIGARLYNKAVHGA